MCNSLFPIRALSIVNQLKLIPEAIQKHNGGLEHTVGEEDDAVKRIVLRSPFLARAIRARYNVKDFRARFAYFDIGYGQVPLLEVYNLEGELIAAPTKVSDLDTDMADAVQVELLNLLLESKGISLTMV